MTLGILVLAAALAGPAGPASPASPASQRGAVAPAPSSAPPAQGSTEALSQAYSLFLEAEALDGRDDLPGAIAAYRRAAQLWPAGAEIRAELAGALARDGKVDEALKEGEAALAIDAGNRSAHRTLGFVLSEKADAATDRAQVAALMAEAIGHFEKVRAQRLVDTGADLELARLYVRAGRDSQAIESLQALLSDRPDLSEAMVLLGQVYERTHQLPKAIDVVKALIEEMPTQVRYRTWLADLHEQSGQWQDAAAVWGQLAERNTNAAIRTRQAQALVNGGDYRGAVAILEDARRRDAKDIDVLFSLAAAYERAQQFDQAEQTFRDVIATQPANAEALNYLGYMLADHGEKLDEAVDLIKRALTVEADNPSFLDSLGWAYVKQAKLDQARDPLQRAAAALPTNSVILDHVAELYFQLKRYGDAAAAWDRALAGDGRGIDSTAVTQKRDRARTLAK